MSENLTNTQKKLYEFLISGKHRMLEITDHMDVKRNCAKVHICLLRKKLAKVGLVVLDSNEYSNQLYWIEP